MKNIFKALSRPILDALARRMAARVATGLLESEPFTEGLAWRIRMETLLASAHSRKAPDELFGDFGDRFWFWLCTEGRRASPELQAILPGLPPEGVQLKFTGSKGDAGLSEGFRFYQLTQALYETHVGPLPGDPSILDFGCGWGRILRFFLKDAPPSSLWGADPVEEMITFCRRSNKWCRFELLRRQPPSDLPAERFDLVYGYSVFSHLSEKAHSEWLVEMRRILRPGGLLVLTTRGRDFIARCEALRKDPRLSSYVEGVQMSAKSFLDVAGAQAEYDSGRTASAPMD